MTETLKLEKSEAVLPGLALPGAFLSLDNRLDSTLQLCRLNGLMDGPLLGLVTVCQELQDLLKFAFIENGLLASRIEILTRYQMESVKKTDKKVAQVELGHKTTKKHVKKLRKRLSVYETLQRRKNEKWWDVKVKSTDYDTFSSLARGAGCPDLQFMLRVNQILIDFVNDSDRQELVLPPMGIEERAELSKLSSIYKLRCRYGKSTQLASSTLIKARQTTIPNPGEVDTVLDSFARTHKRTGTEETLDSGSKDVPVKDSTSAPLSKQKPSSPRIDIPSTMLTPLSALSSPTIDVGSSSLSLGQSPPASGLSTPTAESAPKLQRISSTPSESSTSDQKKSAESGTHDKPPPSHKGKPEPPKPIQLKDPRLAHMNVPPSKLPSPASLTIQQQLQYAQLQQHGRTLNLTGAQVASGALASKSFLSGGGSILFQGQLRTLGHPAVVASPVKVAQMTGSEGRKGGEGDGGKRDKEAGATSAKRIRLTRKSAGGNLSED